MDGEEPHPLNGEMSSSEEDIFHDASGHTLHPSNAEAPSDAPIDPAAIPMDQAPPELPVPPIPLPVEPEVPGEPEVVIIAQHLARFDDDLSEDSTSEDDDDDLDETQDENDDVDGQAEGGRRESLERRRNVRYNVANGIIGNDAIVDPGAARNIDNALVPVENIDPQSPPVIRGGLSSFLPFPRRIRNTVPFDQTLPATHSYLGSDMEDVGGGQTMYDAERILENVCLFTVPHLILMPGQTLPLQSLHPRAIAMFRNIVATQRLFGVLSMSGSHRSDNQLDGVGTLAQVIAFKEDSAHELTTVKVRAVGRQRFKLLETQRSLDGTLSAKVQILPEVELTNLLDKGLLPSLHNHSIAPCSSHGPSKSQRIESLVSSKMFALPSFVYDQYNLTKLVERVKTELSEWYDAGRIGALAQNPVEFSYWVASNLPVEDSTKIKILSMNCALQRLRFELSIITKCTKLCCRECGEVIGDKSEVFSMSVEGPMGAYVNEHGFIHETLTLKTAIGVEMIGRQTAENSWFPGYAWRILQCRQCRRHMGWRFKAVERNTDPKMFWGITRSAIIPTIAPQAQSEDTPKPATTRSISNSTTETTDSVASLNVNELLDGERNTRRQSSNTSNYEAISPNM